jgi:hypothetical protein
MNELKDIKATEIRLFLRFLWIWSHFDIENANSEGDWLFKTHEIIRQLLFALQNLLFSNNELYYNKNLNYVSAPQWHLEWRLFQNNLYLTKLATFRQLKS